MKDREWNETENVRGIRDHTIQYRPSKYTIKNYIETITDVYIFRFDVYLSCMCHVCRNEQIGSKNKVISQQQWIKKTKRAKESITIEQQKEKKKNEKEWPIW